MTTQEVGFFARIPLAFGCFFRALGDGAFARRVRDGEPAAVPALPASQQLLPVTAAASDGPAFELLALLQREGRLVDFLMQPIDGFADAEVGAAARHVHAGCRAALVERTEIAPVHDVPEGQRVTLADGFEASAWKLVGSVKSKGPYVGKLIHRGWQCGALRLPASTQREGAYVLAPAELEV